MGWDYDDPWDYESDDPCEHADYDVDMLTGRAHCYRCGETWWLSGDELSRELKFQAEAYEAFSEEMERTPVPAPEAADEKR